MQSLSVAALVFVCVFGGALIGMYLRSVLPAEHLGQDTKEVIGLGMGLLATLTALLLAMVTSTAKQSFDLESDQIKQAAINILVLDRTLVDYGPETQGIRESLRRSLQNRLALTWPAARGGRAQLQSAEVDADAPRLAFMIRQLTPQNDFQRGQQSQALQLAGEFLKARWTMLEGLGPTIPTPFLAVVVCWLTLIFTNFGLFSPSNATAMGALFICALAVAGCVFLILELDTPFSGLMKVSGAPLRFALSQLGR